MSAWLCSEEHISLIANLTDKPDAAFQILVGENIRSLEARYPGRDFLEEWKGAAAQYYFRPVIHGIADKKQATMIVKQCDCFDYQACETDDYRDTEAAKLVEQVRAKAIKAGGETEGALWESMPWGLD